MKLGYAFTGSFCTISRSIGELRALSKENEIIPIVSETVYNTDTRFGKSSDIISEITGICGKAPLCRITETEPLGPALPLDALIISPCTGNTLAKLACGITDTSVTMAAKAHLRCDRPVVIALASNDALSGNLKNIAALLSRKSVYFVPFGQDSPDGKPHSLVCDFTLIGKTLSAAITGKQLQPLLL